MNESGSAPEILNLVTYLERVLKDTPWAKFLLLWENVIFSLIIAVIMILLGFLALRKRKLIPGRAQNAAESFVGGLDDFITGIMGPRGRRYTPFIGTLFIYILFMNISGIIPFMKSSTSSWSTTLALALCVFVYVQYTAFSELGFLGYMDRLMEKPRGFLAFSVIYPLLMLSLHIISELVKPISLSLRLRSNIWGDDMLLAVLSGFGLKGVPLLLFSSVLILIAAVIQTVVFCLLTTIYFAFILIEHEEEAT
ncbi:MAG: F0F1 ATP synthase subunit A [Candidatus Omnitrophica bacterium]|nr:F0F1 ATP synthase subunit A [Candidatus Omnitrophota bacterium]MDD5610656.1 F0F1 ATP synthase subunit A [Candidatus Omnitrophota bacterium]